MHDLRIGAADLLAILKPDSFIGATLYLFFFVLVALLLARALRVAVRSAMTRHGNLDRTTISFLQQVGTAAIWVIMLILYAHLIPVLRSMGTALLTGVSIASVVIGLAAQSTLGNLVAGVSITIYRPFRLGDTLQVAAPTGTEVGNVAMISLGYTTLRTSEGRLVVLPNSIAASQVTINLSNARAPAPMSVVIRVSREIDVTSARELAQRVAREVVGEGVVTGCFLTKIEAASAVLELRIQAPAAAAGDELRSRLISSLARRFAEAGFDSQGPERPSFSA
ncbi:MAG TPA: mechanosensitive ion channel domain-containing protein [Steroidobacteraceae bacterium]